MRRRKKNSFVLLLLVLLLGIGVGYALLTQNFNIIGSSTLASSTWDIHFDNLQVTEGSVSLEEGDSAATIDQSTHTDINYAVTLSLPGDFYEFTVDVVNAGTIDGMVSVVTSKLNNVVIDTEHPVPDYLTYSVKYYDDIEIEESHLLAAGETETYKVRVEFDSEITGANLPSDTQTLNFNFGVTYVQADDTAVERDNHKLYNVLKDAAKAGSYALKYTGAHRDSYARIGTKDIYHWYGSNNATGTAIQDKNNVIFAGQCWQMIRTTDTGGVKLIYNGEAENNQCLNTRGNHVGYDSRTSQNLADNYYYGTDYNYDSTNNVFSLSGSLTQNTWNETTGPTLIGKYTCKQTTESGTCATLYLVESYRNTSSGYVIPLNYNSHYSRFGELQYNASSNSLSYVGYMYNTVYPYQMNALLNTTTYKYAASFTYSGGTYTLSSDSVSFAGSGASDITSINTHHYTCWNKAGECTSISYIYYYSSPYMYYINLTNGESIEDAINKMLYANDVNTINSTIKTGIDAWYAKYLNPYDSYIEDTIFCNNRSQNNESNNGWNPNGGDINVFMFFYKGKDLSCDNETDQFSTLNSKAQLTYKTGLMSNPEMNLLNNNKARVTSTSYWFASPYSFNYFAPQISCVDYSGLMTGQLGDYASGVRPAISLKPGTTYTSGDGSMASPYIVN